MARGPRKGVLDLGGYLDNGSAGARMGLGFQPNDLLTLYAEGKIGYDTLVKAWTWEAVGGLKLKW